MAKKYYVVWTGREPGIYSTWDECKAQTHGFPKARFKSYRSLEQAQQAYAAGSSHRGRKSADAQQKAPQSTHTASKPTTPDTFAMAIYCDGGCEPNPGPSGTGMVVYEYGSMTECWYGHHEAQGTNNRAELQGIASALERIAASLDEQMEPPEEPAYVIFCDSQYAIDCVTKWAKNWRRNNWKTGKGKSVKNQALIAGIYDRWQKLRPFVALRKVKGHTGIEGNELADELAAKARTYCETSWVQSFDQQHGLLRYL